MWFYMISKVSHDIMKEKYITVYCGSSSRLAPKYYEQARETGELIAHSGFGLMTGGGVMGMMRAVQDGCLQAGGEAVGVIPGFMVENGWNATNLTDLVTVEDMHARKKLLAERSYGCIALPGGLGTWDEICEILAWRQLGIYHGNVVIADFDGYYAGLRMQVEKALQEGFFGEAHTSLWRYASTPAEAVALATAPHNNNELPSKRF